MAKKGIYQNTILLYDNENIPSPEIVRDLLGGNTVFLTAELNENKPKDDFRSYVLGKEKVIYDDTNYLLNIDKINNINISDFVKFPFLIIYYLDCREENFDKINIEKIVYGINYVQDRLGNSIINYRIMAGIKKLKQSSQQWYDERFGKKIQDLVNKESEELLKSYKEIEDKTRIHKLEKVGVVQVYNDPYNYIEKENIVDSNMILLAIENEEEMYDDFISALKNFNEIDLEISDEAEDEL